MGEDPVSAPVCRRQRCEGVQEMNRISALRTWAEIDLDAIKGNFAGIRKKIPKTVKLLAVIKADAYGHGAVQVARALESNNGAKADFFAVAMVDEAIELRKAGIRTPIMLLGYAHPSTFDALIRYGIRPTIYRLEDAQQLQSSAARLKASVNVHLALDTGMSRIGFPDTDAGLDAVRKIAALPNLSIEGLFSHFASADEPDKTYANLQRSRFSAFDKRLKDAGIEIPIRHLYNSAATIDMEPLFDMMREGIILYGLHPSPTVDLAKIDGLRPAMALKSRVIHLKQLEEGVPVSYGCTYVTGHTTRVATISAGYADGVPRLLSNRGHVLLHGFSAPIIGRVCMDQFMVDVTDIPEVEVGDTVTLFGRDGDAVLYADDVAALAQTIGYELVCGITKRVPRVYTEQGNITEIHYGIPHVE